MLTHDNLQWCISLILCLLCTNGVIGSVIKPDILESLDDIAGYDLTEEDMHKYHIWPQGIIPYYIDDFSYDKVLRDKIRSNLDTIGKVTGLHFTEIPQPPKDDESRWVFFLNRKAGLGCEDVVYQNFTTDGVQKVVLGYDCMKPEDLAEIILSLVGVAPQHNSPDRDDYITVNMENILPDKQYLFKKIKPEDWMFSKLEYDFESAGHYNTHKYTINGAETISPKKQEDYIKGSKGLSAMDIKKIRTTYNYISHKGKNQINVPECSKLFVTGPNFTNYEPATKSDNLLKRPSPNHLSFTSSENSKLNLSKEVHSHESSKANDDINEKSNEKPNDSKDKIDDEVTDTEHKPETSKETKTDSGPNGENESRQQINPNNKPELKKENNNVSKKKLALFTIEDTKTGSGLNNDNDSQKQRYSLDKQQLIQKNNNLKKKLSLLTFKDTKTVSGLNSKSDSPHQSNPDIQQLKKENNLLEKKMSLLTGKDTKTDSGQNSDNDSPHQSNPDIQHLKKENNLLEKKMSLLTGKDTKTDSGQNSDNDSPHQSNPDIQQLKKENNLLKKKMSLLTGKDTKTDSGLNSGNDSPHQSNPDIQHLKKENNLLKKKMSLLTGKDTKIDSGLNSGNESPHQSNPDIQHLKKENNLLKKKMSLLTGKDTKTDSGLNSGNDSPHQSNPNLQQLKNEKKIALLKVNAKDKKGKKYLLEKLKLLKQKGKKPGKKENSEKLLLKSDYSTGDEDNNSYLNERQKFHFN